MNKQMSLSALSDELSQVRTKKQEFLAEIDRIVPWGEWISLIRPCYYKGERGNKPYDLERMLRIYLVQNLYNMSDMATVAEVIDSRAFSDFCGVESSNCMMSVLLPTFSPMRKNKSTVTADILEQKSVPKPERKIRPERKSGTKLRQYRTNSFVRYCLRFSVKTPM